MDESFASEITERNRSHSMESQGGSQAGEARSRLNGSDDEENDDDLDFGNLLSDNGDSQSVDGDNCNGDGGDDAKIASRKRECHRE